MFSPFLRVAFVLVLVVVVSIPAAFAQDDDWTCDEGPNDILNAAWAAFDAGDLDTAEALAVEAQTVCASNFTRMMEANPLLNEINAARAAEQPSEDGPAYADVRYGPADGSPRQVLDVFLPDDVAGPLPVVLLFHGSGGSKESHLYEARRITGWGYAAVPVEYREQAGATTADRVKYMVADAFCALAWVQAEGAAYDLDPAHVVIGGYSQGGYVSSLLGTIDDPAMFADDCSYDLPDMAMMQEVVRGIITAGGPVGDPATVLNDDYRLNLLTVRYNVEPDEMIEVLELLQSMPIDAWRTQTDWPNLAVSVAQAHPLFWIDGSEPPFLVLHSETDDIIPIGEAEALAAALESSGSDVTLVIAPRVGHASLSSYYAEVKAFLADVFAAEE